MIINKPISRRKALKIMGLGVLASCIPTLPIFGKSKKEKKKNAKRLIFYFSATGNSLYIARQIGGETSTLLSISQEIHNEHPKYEAEEIGFVFPIYCFLPPAIVQDFIARSSFKADYFFTVGTYGAHHATFPESFDKFTSEHGVKMNYVSSIQMVDTYLPYFDMEKEKAIDKKIPENLAVILSALNQHANYIQPVSEMDRHINEGYFRSSGRDRQRPTVTRSEKIVFATNDCVGCGICTSVCPASQWIQFYASFELVSLLNDTTKTLTEVSDLMHFENISYFSRYVKKTLGKSPSQYRQK